MVLLTALLRFRLAPEEPDEAVRLVARLVAALDLLHGRDLVLIAAQLVPQSFLALQTFLPGGRRLSVRTVVGLAVAPERIRPFLPQLGQPVVGPALLGLLRLGLARLGVEA